MSMDMVTPGGVPMHKSNCGCTGSAHQPGCRKGLYHSRKRNDVFDAASQMSTMMAGFNPRLEDENEALRLEGKDLTARSRHIYRNDGMVSGSINMQMDFMVGEDYRLQPIVNTKALGWTPEQGRELQESIKCQASLDFESDSFYMDARRGQTMTGMTGTNGVAVFVSGEGFAQIVAIDSPDRPFQTALKLVDNMRIFDPPDANVRSDPDVYRGIRYDEHGAATQYCVHDYPEGVTPRKRRKNREINKQYDWVPARFPWGREQMLHVFDRRHAAEAKRGRPLLTPVIPTLKGVKSLSNAMLNHAHTQALIVATIKSTLAARDIFDSDFSPSDGEASPYTKYMEDSSEWTDRTNLYWCDNKIIKLFPHEELDTKSPGTPFGSFDAFEQSYHAENARGMGMDYSSYAGRFDRSSYSTSRMILMREWRRYMTVRKMIHSNFSGRAYCAWLEEQLESGRVPFPRGVRERLTTRNRRHNFFLANKDALCGNIWYGPPREDADPAKGAVARRINRELRLETLTSQLAERGRDINEVVEEIINERLFEADSYEAAGLQNPEGLANIPHEVITAALQGDN